MFPLNATTLTCWAGLPFTVPVTEAEQWTFEIDTTELAEDAPEGSVSIALGFLESTSRMDQLRRDPAVSMAAAQTGMAFDELVSQLGFRRMSVAVVEISPVASLGHPRLLAPAVVEAVNRVVRPLLVIRRIELLRPIGRGDLGPASPVVLYDSNASIIDAAMLSNMNTGATPDRTDRQVVDRDSWALFSRWLDERDPLILGSYWRSRAATSIALGHNDDGVVQLAVGLEQLVYEIDQAFGRATGCDDAELTRRRDGQLAVAMNRVQPELGGSWDRTRTGTEVGDYWKLVKTKRDRITHQADHATPREAQLALEASNQFLLFILNQLVERKQQLPEELAQYVEDPRVIDVVRQSMAG